MVRSWLGRYQHCFGSFVLIYWITDTFKTIAQPSPEVIFKDRKSKFYGYAFPVSEETEIKPILEQLRKKQPSANHFCYAWQMGVGQIRYRANDDGEPNNSAGKPIYGQIQSFGITNVLVVVARIFGGAKLGVSGLVNAYRSAAQMALEASKIEERVLQVQFKLIFEYPLMNDVMRLIKKLDLNIVSQEMTEKCMLEVSIAKSKADMVQSELKQLHQLKVQML